MRFAPTVWHFTFLTNLTRPAGKGVRLALALALVAIAGAVVASASSAAFRALLFGRLSASGHRSPNSQSLETSSSAVAKNSAVARPLAAPATDAQLNKARRGHTATMLADGKVLIAGGEDANGFVTEAEIYDPVSATFSISGNLNTPRADHTATRLADGRVLIAGGRADLGVLNSTEIFDPVIGAFTSGPNLNSARSGQSATVLSDGRIIVAGGDASGSVETYDPSANAFTFLGTTMLAPRAFHSAALLNDGNILIAGGTLFDSSPALSGEILNLSAPGFVAVDNELTDPHVRATARVLPDGKVQIIGGTDHEDMEIYDPAINRFGAHAHVFPIGDIHPQLLQEILDSPMRSAMFRLGASTALLNRTGQTITELSESNQALVAGGVDSSGAFLNSASTLNSSAAIITTDKLDYAPGTPVLVSGTGWQPNEVVMLMFHEDPHVGTENPHTFTVQADANGMFVNQQYAPEDQDAGLTYILAANGQSSGWSAQTSFTDAPFTGTLSGNWSNPATWGNAGSDPGTPGVNIPGASDTVLINGGISVTVNISNAACSALNLTPANDNTTATLNFVSGGTGQLTVGGVVTVGSSTGNNRNGSLDMGNGGTLKVGGGALLLNNAGFAAGSGTVEYNGSSQTVGSTAYNNLTLSGSGPKTMTGVSTINGNFTLAGTANTTGVNTGMTIGGNVTIGSGATFAAGTSLTHNVGGNWTNNGTFSFTTGSTINFNTAGSKTISGSSSTAFNNLTVNKGTSTSNVLDATGPMSMSGNLTLTNGLFRLTNASASAQFGGSSTIAATAGIEINGGTLNGNNGTVSNNGLFRVKTGSATVGTSSGNALSNGSTGTVDVQGGTLNIAGRLLNSGGTTSISGGTINICTVGLSLAGNASFEMSPASNLSISNGTVAFQRANSAAGGDLLITSGAGTKSITGGTFQIGNASTPASQTIKINSTVPIFNLTVNSANATAKLDTNSLTVNGSVTISAGTLDANNLAISVFGNWSNSGSFTPGIGTVSFDSASSHSIGGSTSTTFFKLFLHPGADVTLNTNATVNNTLGLAAQKMTTGTNTLALDSAATVTRTSGYVVGNLQRSFNTGTGQSFTFDIGDATNYTPAALSSLNVTVAGNITASTTSNDTILSNAGSGINAPKDVNRTWNLTRGGGLTLILYDAAFTYAASDKDGGTTESNFILRKLTSGSWSSPATTSVDTLNHKITGTGFTSMSDFAVGEAEAADLQVTNSDAPDPVNVGENITYTIVFTNNGPSTADTVTVSDLMSLNTTFVSTTTPAGWTRTDSVPNGGTGTLTFTKDTSAANGDSATFTVVAKVNSNVAANIDIQNVASTTSSTADSNTANNTATAHTNTQTSADLEVAKTDSPDPVTVGNNITYTISLTNHGPSDAQNVTVTDTVPANTTFVSSAVTLGSGWSTSNPTVGGTGNVVFSKTIVLAAETATFTVVVKVHPNATTSLITNNAVAASTTTDPTSGNNTGTATTTVTQADLSVTNSDAPDPVNVGENITYTIVFTNNGPSTADTVTVSDLLSLNTTFVSTTTPAGWTRTDSVAPGSSGTLTFTKSSAANAETATFTVVAKVNTNVAGNIHIINKASATSTTHDPDSSNNTDITADTTTQTRADLEVTKTDSPDPVIAGNNITYTISFTNHGPSDAQDVTVTDAVPANTTFVSSAVTVGTGWSTSNPSVGGTGDVVFSKTSVIALEPATFTVVVKVNGNTTDGTTITNNAVAASTTTDPVPGNNTGNATTTALSPGTISFSGAPFSNNETNADQDVTITVQRTGGSGGAVSVHYATSAGTATAGSDYVETSGDLNWADGDSANKTFTVTVKGDTTFEADETVSLTLSAPTNGAVIGGTNPTMLTITNDDSQPTVQFSAASSAGAESVTPANLEVTLSNPSYQTIMVNYAVNGSSTATGGGVDYTLLGTSLTFNPGETSHDVSFTVNDDALDEFDETVVVDLSAPVNATPGSTATHAYSIEDNDDAPTISIDDMTVTEGNSPSTATATFHVTLSGPSGKTITAHYATADDTAVQPGDYTSTSGDLTFLPGQSSKTVEVTVKGDDLDEDNETYYVNLSALVNLNSVGNDAQGVGTITDDDNAPTVQFAAASSAGDESASPVNLAVNLSAPSGKTLTVNYAVNGSSTATGGGVEYTLASGMLTFNPGQMSKNVTFTVNDDNLDENDETVVVDLSAPNNATLGTSATHTYTIQDNDAAPVFTINDVTQAEGNSGTIDLIFSVTKTGPTALTATVDYATANGTTNPATGGAACGAGIDYVSQNGTLSFAPADNTMTVTIKVCGDTLNESNETFLANLSNPTKATISDNQGVGTITNDDNVTYNFEGFFTPVDNPPMVNTAKAGSAIPVKWRLTTAGGAPVSDPNSFVGLFSYEVNCGSTTGLEAPVETVAPGGSGLQYLGNGNWQINWKTLPNYPKGSCRVMELRLNDGTSHDVNFKFK